MRTIVKISTHMGDESFGESRTRGKGGMYGGIYTDKNYTVTYTVNALMDDGLVSSFKVTVHGLKKEEFGGWGFDSEIVEMTTGIEADFVDAFKREKDMYSPFKGTVREKGMYYVFLPIWWHFRK